VSLCQEDILIFNFQNSRAHGALVSKGQKTNINFKDMLNLAQNALTLSPLLLLVGKSAVTASIGKETLFSVGNYSTLGFQL